MGRWFKRLFWVFWLIVLVAIAGVGLYVYYVPLPDLDLATPNRFLDQNGLEIPTTHNPNWKQISQEDMPQHLREAFIAIEDYRFYRHFGIDPLGIGRAFWRNLQAGRILEGGSTITQQLAKNLFLTPERTLERKLRELLLTLQLEVRYSKDEILTLYLNKIYFGHGAYGIEAAAQTYFAKPASELSLAESALLAGVPRAPARYSPFLDGDAAIARQHLVLDRMSQLGYISPQEAQEAKGEKISLAQQQYPLTRHQYFIDFVVAELEEQYPHLAPHLEAGGLTIHTTLDLNHQWTAPRAKGVNYAPSPMKMAVKRTKTSASCG